MEEIELISSNNGETFNKQLINFSGKYAIKKEKNAKRISEWREKQELTKNVTCNENVCNTDKVKESKVNKNKEYKRAFLSEITISDFPELNSNYIEIAKAFNELFKSNLIEAGASTISLDKAKGTWIDDIRLLIETDNYTVEHLRNVYQFLQKDAFWKQNILSTSKLREKMPKIKLKMHNGTATNRNANKEATSWGELAEIANSIVNS
jgi:hypothetical protein